MTVDSVTLADVIAARGVAGAVAKHTPVVSSVALSDELGQPVVLKAESLQRTGSFKIRGAMNKVASLGDRAKAGVTAGSAGNHAQALAFAARHFGVPCEIFVPAGAPITKIEACRTYGATVIEGGSTVDEAIAAARELAERDGKGFCHPYDDPAVVAGQGTLGLELVEDLDDLRCVVVPLGGGGLACGVAIAVKSLMPDVRVVGVQAALCSPYTGAHVDAGPVPTLADGIAVKQPGALTRPLVEHWVDDIVTVSEDAIADAMVLLMDRAKLYVEGAGAVGVAALRSGAVAPARRWPHVRRDLGRQRRPRRRPGADPPPRDDRRTPPRGVREDRRPPGRTRQVPVRVRRERRQPHRRRALPRGRQPQRARDRGARHVRGPWRRTRHGGGRCRCGSRVRGRRRDLSVVAACLPTGR